MPAGAGLAQVINFPLLLTSFTCLAGLASEFRIQRGTRDSTSHAQDPMNPPSDRFLRRSFRTLATLLTGLHFGLLVTAIPVKAQVTVGSITPTTNGVRIAWEDSATNQIYTVQMRDSLASGDWRNANTRYRWPWPFAHWVDTSGNRPDSRFYRVISESAATPNRGKLLTDSLKGQWNLNTQKSSFRSWGVDSFTWVKNGIVSRMFTYETVDPHGLSITASALLILPMATNGPLPLVSVQHGTLARKADAPSRPDSGEIYASVLASIGYAVVVPDYLGLGSSPGYQGYLHADSEATCVVDALRAGRDLCNSNNVTLNGHLFLTGFSQGGHVTMAAHRELEAFHTDEFTVTASAPCAGTYDLGGVTTEGIIAVTTNYPVSYPFAMIVAAYLPIYQLADSLEELLAERYRHTLPPLLDGAHTEAQLLAALPRDPVAILRPDFEADFRSNPDNPLRRALMDNNTYHWTPRAPTKLIHCRGDSIALFSNAEVAYQAFTNRSACCVSIVDPGAPAELDHEDCYLPSLREVLSWFASFQQ
jgi:dienelactone hydrolase